MSLGDLTKLPAMVLCLGKPPGVCDFGCCSCCFPHWRFLRFRATFPCHRQATLASQPREGLHQLWALDWLISIAFSSARFFCHSFTASATVLRGHVLLTGFYYLVLFSHIFDTFCDPDAGRNTTSRILLCACPHSVVPSGWHMDLNYSYCSYQTIDLSIAPVSYEV